MLAVFTALLWAQSGPGALWSGLERANCTGGSSAYAAVSAGSTSRTLSANTSEWQGHYQGDLVEGQLELTVWTFVPNTLVLGLLSVDNVTVLNQTYTVSPVANTVLKVPFHASVPHSIELRVDAVNAKNGIVLFSCLQFRARFSSTTTTTGLLPPPDTPPEEETPEEPGSTAAWAEGLLVVAFGLFFVVSLVVPFRRSEAGDWPLENRIPSQGFFYAWLRHRGENVYVVGFTRPATTVPRSVLSGPDFCPFLGSRGGVHLYATGNRDHPDKARAGTAVRLRWMVSLSRATAAAHAAGQSVGSLTSLWVDPDTQELAVADCYCYPPSHRGNDLGTLGQLAADLLADFRNEEVLDLIDRCLDTDAARRPSASECEAVFRRACHSFSSQPSGSCGLSGST